MGPYGSIYNCSTNFPTAARFGISLSIPNIPFCVNKLTDWQWLLVDFQSTNSRLPVKSVFLSEGIHWRMQLNDCNLNSIPNARNLTQFTQLYTFVVDVFFLSYILFQIFFPICTERHNEQQNVLQENSLTNLIKKCENLLLLYNYWTKRKWTSNKWYGFNLAMITN